MFGEHSFMITVVLIVIAWVGTVGATLMGGLGMVTEKVMTEWCSRIDTYLLAVQKQLLNVGNGAGVEKAVADVAMLQEKHEVWAREMNRAYGRQNGIYIPLLLLWSFMPLAMIAVPSEDATRLPQVIVLVSFASFFVLFFVQHLTGLTKVNMTWERGTTRLLNDARIQLLRLNTLGTHGAFARWLKSHELNAARAGGVKVTLTLLRSSAGAVGSAFVLASYLVLRENLSGLLVYFCGDPY